MFEVRLSYLERTYLKINFTIHSLLSSLYGELSWFVPLKFQTIIKHINMGGSQIYFCALRFNT